jgi:DNA helicase-2/ATP-dependent DNA helicase PcrA
MGDRHVYASRTRFIPNALISLFERTSWPAAAPNGVSRASAQGARIDVGARVRGMWR